MLEPKTEQGENAVNRRNELQRVLLALAVGVVGLILNANVSAQVQTQTYTSTGQPTTEVKVDRGTVLLVDGNDLVVKAEDGHLVHLANVPESARATVDGQELGIHDLKPGMKLQRTITTTTTPQTITTVKHVTGTVWSVNPPSSVILTFEDGENQAFKIADGQKFNIDGQITDAWGLQKGMKVSATVVTEVPETVIDQEKAVTGTMPPPDPPSDLPILVVFVPVDAPAADPAPVETAAAAPDALPKTGSQLPLIGMLGVLALLSGLALRAVRVLG
jgi:LPXTG-motif cell wall-anchored protein